VLTKDKVTQCTDKSYSHYGLSSYAHSY